MRRILFILVVVLTFFSCKDDYLQEDPLSNLSADKILTTPTGFQMYLTGLYDAAREEMSMGDNTYFALNFAATDIAADAGVEYIGLRNYETNITPTNNNLRILWNWAYTAMILRANTIIVYAQKEQQQAIWATEEEKNQVIAEAKFFRAYNYNLLVNSFGDVPIVDSIYNTPRNDYAKASKKDILEFSKTDLEFAVEWLPSVKESEDGRITK